MEQYFQVVPNTDYYINFWVKWNSGYCFTNFSDTDTSIQTFFYPPSNNWELMSIPFSSRSDTLIRFLCYCEDAYLDEFSITKSPISYTSMGACDSLALNSTNITQSGIYLDSLTDSDGCDSLVYVYLTITPSKIAPLQAITACGYYVTTSSDTLFNDSTYHDTLTGYNGCDSITPIQVTIANASTSNIAISSCGEYLSPSGRFVWGQSGVYQDTITNMQGCDSVINIDLNILNSYDTITPVSCDSFVSPSNIYTWFESGIYLDTLVNANSCDSVIYIDLQINKVDVELLINENTISVVDTSLAYQWLDCNQNYKAILGETDYSLQNPMQGTYAVEVSNGTCVDTSGCVNFTMIDSPQNFPFDLKISNKWLYIHTHNNLPYRVMIYNLKGQLISDKKAIFKDNLSFLLPENEMYFVTIWQNDTTYSKVIQLR